MAPLIPIVLLGVGALVIFAKAKVAGASSGAGQAGAAAGGIAASGSVPAAGGAAPSGVPGLQPGQTLPASSILDSIAAVMATGDPNKMQVVADQLDAAGYKTQAADLRAVIAKLKSGGLPSLPGQVPAQPQAQPQVQPQAQPAQYQTPGIAYKPPQVAPQAQPQAQPAQYQTPPYVPPAQPAQQPPSTAAPVVIPGIGPVTGLPPNVAATINQVLASNSPEQLTMLAWSLASAYPDLANQLLARYGSLSATKSPSVLNKKLAADAALAVHTHKPAQETTAAVAGPLKAFQTAEGLKVDGKYGPGSGLRIAVYGIVPDKPWHWGTASGGIKSVNADKAKWAAAMLAYAKADPTRAEEWAAAAKV